MLVEYLCENYGIIKEPIRFQFFTGMGTKTNSDHTHTENIYTYKKSKWGTSWLGFYPTTVLFGNNGSGKSTVFESIGTMQQIVTKDIHSNTQKFVPAYGDTENSTMFGVNILVHNEYYNYTFRIKDGIIKEELLSKADYRKDKQNHLVVKSRGKSIYTRKNNKVRFGKDIEKAVFKEALSLMNENTLLLTCASKTVKECKDVYQFFTKSLMIVKDREMYALETLSKNKDIKQIVLNALYDFGYNIVDIKIDDGTERFERVSKKLLKEYGYDVELNKKRGKTPYTATIIKKNGSVAFHNESEGLKNLIYIMTQIAEAVLREKVLVYDDIDTHLHTSIVKDIVEFTTELYANNSKKRKHPQFIFTTHCLPVMNLDILRKDQIWFTEYNTRRNEFSLYSLCEFKGMENAVSSVYRPYIDGRFGSVPLCTNGLSSILNPTMD